MSKVITTFHAPAAIGPYSQAIKVNGMLFVSGQLPVNVLTGEFAPGGIEAQTIQSLQNMQAIIEAARTSMKKVIKTTVFLADMSDFAAMNAQYETFFKPPYPARSTVAVKGLPKGALVEIECICAI